MALLVWNIALGATSLSAQTLYVNADSPACPGGDGASWATAFCDLQDALDAAQSGNSIWVAQGVYRPTKAADGSAPSSHRLKTFFINKNIKLYGGFAGTETALQQRDWAQRPTILSGDVGTLGTHTDNSYHVVWFNGVSNAAMLNGFIIEHGFANGTSGANNDVGAGIYINGDDFVESSPLIVNCILRDNYSGFSSGAAIYVCARWDGVARPMFLQCQFVQSGLFSQGIARHYARARGRCEPEYRQCTFYRNNAPSGGYEMTNHVEFAAPGATRAEAKGYNTIIWNNLRAAQATTGGFTSAVSRINLNHCLTDSISTGVIVVSSIAHQDPLLENPAAGIFNLQAGSPAINAGNDAFVDTLTRDLAVKDRISGASVDIGAYEFQVDCAAGPAVAVLTGFSDCAGYATALPSGGLGPFSYQWSDGQTDSTAVGLAAGNYAVTVTDALGCIAVEQAVISSLPELQIAAELGGFPGCDGLEGQASANAAGGLPPYVYQWSDGQAGPQAAGLAPGSYSVTATDASGCQVVAEIVIPEFEELELELSALAAVKCFGAADGSAAAVASGGVPPYSYQWSDGQSGASAVGLAAGAYAITVTDAEGCAASAVAYIPTPAALTVELQADHASSCSGADGQIEASAAGGTPPYVYLWSDGQTGASATGLPAGIYDVSITDEQGCQAVATAIVFTADADFESEIAILQQPTCSSAHDGAASVATSGGLPPFAYAWSDGQTTPIATGLPPGQHAVVITDAAGCVAVDTVVLAAQYQMFVGMNLLQSIACHGDSTGSVRADAIGGAPPFEFLWDNGEDIPVLSGLPPGNYFVTITDANGCTSSGGAMLNSPPQLEVAFAAVFPTCEGSADGQAIAAPTGGTPPYAFLWSDGQASAEAFGLEAGMHGLTVTDSKGCTAEATATIEPIFYEPNLWIEAEGTTLTAAETGAEYQWIDCDTGLPIPGATQQSYTATQNGRYAVVLSDGECQEISDCVEVIIVSASEAARALAQATAFPNPNAGQYTLALPWPAELSLYDTAGRLLHSGRYPAGQHDMVMAASAGLYLLVLRSAEGVQTLRLVRQ